MDTPWQVRFWAKVDWRGPTACWVWTAFRDRWGYGKFGFNRKTYSAHRLAFELNLNPDHAWRLPSSLCVCHHCDNPACCNPAHLFVGTNADNVADCLRKGRYVAKLVPAQIVSIRRAYAGGGVTLNQIAKRFGVTRSTVGYIINRRSWRHIPHKGRARIDGPMTVCERCEDVVPRRFRCSSCKRLICRGCRGKATTGALTNQCIHCNTASQRS